ncbi:Chromo domain/shadow and Chromo domain-like and Chromo domain-containing protein [Strongyloides ratti]|uniref:Chromo domain/shadow and Chromo domain-like and Chromo domain-containing protein n=1 Tax=Strongyloides ratti TaxID=34506 RepID=A0A090KY37_STRRB|nr:Chromo domain/shadow and Chromo domain-like and Chromo domain-containing protein [Strongyloides ratti]CEF62336.1 Chromo domain/shadow and Chromo domain-like and Chromo domain-containing protein [Strongyloides ratti]
MATSNHNYSSSDDGDEFVVEDILRRRVKEGVDYYKIKWEGYPLSECTWEPSSNLSKSLIKRYEKSISRGTPFSETVSDDTDSDEDNYHDENKCSVPEIKEILEKKKKKGVVKYKVLYNNENVDWIMEEDIKDESLLKAFQAKKRRREATVEDNDDVVAKKIKRASGGEDCNKVVKKTTKATAEDNDDEVVEKLTSATTENDDDEVVKKIREADIPRNFNSPIDLTPKTTKRRRSDFDSSRQISGCFYNPQVTMKFKSPKIPTQNPNTNSPTSDGGFYVIDEDSKDGRSNFEEEDESRGSHTISETTCDKEDILLVRLIRKARKGIKHSEDNIAGILGMQCNESNEELYLIQLKDKNLVFMYFEDIPHKFRGECRRISSGRIFC